MGTLQDWGLHSPPLQGNNGTFLLTLGAQMLKPSASLPAAGSGLSGCAGAGEGTPSLVDYESPVSDAGAGDGAWRPRGSQPWGAPIPMPPPLPLCLGHSH